MTKREVGQNLTRDYCVRTNGESRFFKHSSIYNSDVIDENVTKERDLRPQLQIACQIKAFMPNLSIGMFLNFGTAHPFFLAK